MPRSHRDVPAHAASADGTLLAHEIVGEGPPLVHVTGAICSRRFPPVVKDVATFATAFRVVTYDRRGRGDSGDTAPWSVEREVEDIEAMIDAVGGTAYLHGHSSGAVLALHAAARLGDKVRGVVLYDAPWAGDAAQRAEYAVLCDRVEALLDRGRHAAALRCFLVGIGMPRAFVALLPLMPGWRRMRALAPTLRYDMALTADLPPVDVASSVRVPVHVVVGERSPAELHTVAATLTSAIPDATTAVLPGQDHLVDAKVLLPELVERFRDPVE
ncbi:alpha/beta hydrolase [Nocardioides panacisoli]|uniref:alpha/beta fold hydrolase n=1 Tax=Nocardioides panacisoli TaxID=627624 RepID=UPI001C628764|nr:alpha/beta hydrolase [Nocardioides panacisoli]QYJ03334.1 alpha/beta hydrolase [Nocardioides panacisoli]